MCVGKAKHVSRRDWLGGGPQEAHLFSPQKPAITGWNMSNQIGGVGSHSQVTRIGKHCLPKGF